LQIFKSYGKNHIYEFTENSKYAINFSSIRKRCGTKSSWFNNSAFKKSFGKFTKWNKKTLEEHNFSFFMSTRNRHNANTTNDWRKL